MIPHFQRRWSPCPTRACSSYFDKLYTTYTVLDLIPRYVTLTSSTVQSNDTVAYVFFERCNLPYEEKKNFIKG